MRILSVTTGRSDLGHLEPVWREILKREGWELAIMTLGFHHLSPEWDEIPRRSAGHQAMNDSPEAIAQAMGWDTRWAGWSYKQFEPDLLLVAGDRYEALAAVSAALPFCIPVAHIGGGDETTGSYDNQFRHAITKMAHLHFVAHLEAQAKVLAMGEQEWRVHLTGLPSLDGIREWLCSNPASAERGQELVVIFHPPTLELETAEEQARQLGEALVALGRPVKGFVPGRDVLHEKVRQALVDQCVGGITSEWLAQEPPSDFYRTLSRAACLVGNSSAGIIEACSFGLPVVNIGSRQEGRIKPANVLNAQARHSPILGTLWFALSEEHRLACQGLVNPYGDGHAAARIVATLADLPRSVRGAEGTWKGVLLKKEWPR